MLTLTPPGIAQYAMATGEPMGSLLDELVMETRQNSQDESLNRILLTIRDGLFSIRKK